MAPVLYERIDENNVRIGTKWFKFERPIITWPKSESTIKISPSGVTIFEDGAKRFISNSFYDDIDIENL